jgi:hypothetical protein
MLARAAGGRKRPPLAVARESLRPKEEYGEAWPTESAAVVGSPW